MIFYVTGQKIRYKKSCRGNEQVREAGGRKRKPFLFDNVSEKILEQSQSAVERDKTKHKIALCKAIRIAYLELNIPNKRNVSEINLFKKINFSQRQNKNKC